MQFFLFEQLKTYARDYPERLDTLTPGELEQSLYHRKDAFNGKEDFNGSPDHHRDFRSSYPALRS